MSLTLENLDQFNKLIDDLDKSIKNEVMKKGYTLAAKPLIQELKATAPGKRVAKAMGVKFYEEDQSAGIGARKGRYAGFIAPFFEEGTKERETKTKTKVFTRKRKSHSTGKIGATHFFAEAVKKTEGQVFNGLYDSLIKAYEQVIKKYEKFYK